MEGTQIQDEPLDNVFKEYEDKKNAILTTLKQTFHGRKIFRKVDVISYGKTYNGTTTIYVKDSNSNDDNWANVSFPVTFNCNKHQLQFGDTGMLTGSVYFSKSNPMIKVKKFESFENPDNQRKEKAELPFPLPKHGERLHVIVVTNVESEAYKDIQEIFFNHRDDISFEPKNCSVNDFNELSNAITNAINDKPDVLLIARGGGSSSEFTLFNNKKLTDLVLESGIFTVTGIGHAGDLTYLDQIADMRCITPTHAASEIARVFKEKEKENSIS